jgi:hypothetical protein
MATDLVEACVNQRTHYVDITGETIWVRELIDRHHARAAADGTRIIPFCGFDSVPSDLGTFLMVRRSATELRYRLSSRRGLSPDAWWVERRNDGDGLQPLRSGEAREAANPWLLNPDASSW